MFPECSCVRVCVSPEQTLLARYLGYLLTEFDQIFNTNGLWSKDERIKSWGEKVKVQVYGRVKTVKYTPKCTF